MEEIIIEKLNNKNWELVNWCEFDKYAVQSYCAIHNETEDKNLGDITKVNEKEIEDFNWGCGGSPCQDFSVAGTQGGAEWYCEDCENKYNPLEAHYSQRDKCPKCGSKNILKSRSSLIVELLRVIKEKKPKIFFYENVKNLVSKKFKPTFDLFLKELDEYGYNVYYKVLNAKDYGVPQNRERIYAVIIRKDVDNGKFEFPKPFDNGIRLKDILLDEIDENFYINNEKVEQFLKNIQGSIDIEKECLDTCHERNDMSFATRDRIYNSEKISPTLTAIMYKDPPKVLQVGNILNESNSDAKWDNPQRGRIYSPNGCSPSLNTCGGGGLEPKILENTNKVHKIGFIPYPNSDKPHQSNLVYDTNGISPTIDTVGGKSRGVGILEKSKGYVATKYQEFTDEKGYVPELFNPYHKSEIKDIAPTVTTQCGSTASSATILKLENDFRIRKLCPQECFRLMGFDDKDYLAAKEVVSNSQLYKQTGNSIVVDVLFYIYVELYKAMPELFNNIQLTSFFSGIGAFEKALDRLFECINNGDIEKLYKLNVLSSRSKSYM